MSFNLTFRPVDNFSFRFPVFSVSGKGFATCQHREVMHGSLISLGYEIVIHVVKGRLWEKWKGTEFVIILFRVSADEWWTLVT